MEYNQYNQQAAQGSPIFQHLIRQTITQQRHKEATTIYSTPGMQPVTNSPPPPYQANLNHNPTQYPQQTQLASANTHQSRPSLQMAPPNTGKLITNPNIPNPYLIDSVGDQDPQIPGLRKYESDISQSGGNQIMPQQSVPTIAQNQHQTPQSNQISPSQSNSSSGNHGLPTPTQQLSASHSSMSSSLSASYHPQMSSLAEQKPEQLPAIPRRGPMTIPPPPVKNIPPPPPPKANPLKTASLYPTGASANQPPIQRPSMPGLPPPMIPPQHVIPPQSVIKPPQQVIAPPQQVLAPPKLVMAPPQPALVPSQQVLPPPPKVIPPPPQVLPSHPIPTQQVPTPQGLAMQPPKINPQLPTKGPAQNTPSAHQWVPPPQIHQARRPQSLQLPSPPDFTNYDQQLNPQLMQSQGLEQQRQIPQLGYQDYNAIQVSAPVSNNAAINLGGRLIQNVLQQPQQVNQNIPQSNQANELPTQQFVNQQYLENPEAYYHGNVQAQWTCARCSTIHGSQISICSTCGLARS